MAAEALGMLWALLVDFRAWGATRTITVLDPRFEAVVRGLNRTTLPADETVCALPGEHEEIYLSLLRRCDAALVLAPETNGILGMLTEQAERAGIPLLGSGSSAVAVAGNKEICSRLFDSAEMPTPRTHVTDFVSAMVAARQIGFPLVVKPLDGVGSEGVYLVNRLSDLPAILSMIRRVTAHERILLQSFSSGIPSSVSLLVSNCHSLPLSLNRQLTEISSQFRYRGSHVPFHHPACESALQLACSAAGLIPGLNGYVGVDLILGDDGIELIEINPRLTTSYIGLRQVVQINLAQAIWRACIEGTLPECISLSGQIEVNMDNPDSWGMSR